MKEEEAIAQKEGLEHNLKPPGIQGNRSWHHKRHFLPDADAAEIT
jgi:hypothetical protein